MDQRTDSSQLASCDHIPVIDISNIDSAELKERQELAQAVFDACTQVGFFYIKVPSQYMFLNLLWKCDANVSLKNLEPRYPRGSGE